jgi:hypothetical protein
VSVAIPERLRPLLWPAYCAESEAGYEAQKKNRPVGDDAFTRLRADPACASAAEDDLRAALRIVAALWSEGSRLYEEGRMQAEDLEAECPGAPHRLCDALMGYLGATRH